MRKAINQFIELFYWPVFHFIPLKTFKYAACGATTVMVELIVYFCSHNYWFEQQDVHFLGLTLSSHIAAFVVAFAISFPVGFILNKFIVFTESELRGRVQLFRYGLIVFSCVGLNYLFLKLFVDGFGWYATPSKALTTAIVTVYSYFSQQYFSFKVKLAGENTNTQTT